MQEDGTRVEEAIIDEAWAYQPHEMETRWRSMAGYARDLTTDQSNRANDIFSQRSLGAYWIAVRIA